MKYYFHDYLLEETDVNKTEGCFYYHLYIWCSNNLHYEEEEMEEFVIGVGNPLGICEYLRIMKNLYVQGGDLPYFSKPFLVVNTFDENVIISQVKDKIENTNAKNKRTLIFKMTKIFEWEYSGDNSKVSRFFD